jgi:hypothetical protein
MTIKKSLNLGAKDYKVVKKPGTGFLNQSPLPVRERQGEGEIKN